MTSTAPSDRIRSGVGPLKELLHELQRPSHCLRRPRRDAVGQVEQRGRPVARRERTAVLQDHAAVDREHTAQTLEQRGLARAVGTDEAEDFPLADREGHVVQRGQPAVPLGQIRRVNQAPSSPEVSSYYHAS